MMENAKEKKNTSKGNNISNTIIVVAVQSVLKFELFLIS